MLPSKRKQSLIMTNLHQNHHFLDPAIFSPNPLYFESLLSAVLAFPPTVIYRSFLLLCLLVY